MSRSDVLVDADWVEAHLDDPKVVIVEVDEDTSAYDKNHIKNADPHRLEARTSRTRSAATSSTRRGFEKLLSAKGIANDDTVVLYGGNNNWFASYAYWYFKLYGHEDVKLLDGGRKKWELDSRDLVDARSRSAPATEYKAKPQDAAIRAFRDDVVAAIGTQNLVDVRSPDEFSGKLLAPAHLPQEQSQRPGHVPSARNIPWSKNANDDGTFKSDDELKELYAERERRPGQGHHRVLPHRRALRAHLVRAARAARPGERQELRRLVDRVRLPGRRADRARRQQVTRPTAPADPKPTGDYDMCGAKAGGPDACERSRAGETIIQGSVTRDGEPVTGYVRLLDCERRVHRRGPDLGDRAVPLLRGRRAPGPLRALVPGAHRGPHGRRPAGRPGRGRHRRLRRDHARTGGPHPRGDAALRRCFGTGLPDVPWRCGCTAPSLAISPMMGTCVVLFVLAWAVVRIWSVPAAIGMCVVAMVIPPVAAMVANRRGPDDRWWDDPRTRQARAPGAGGHAGDPESDAVGRARRAQPQAPPQMSGPARRGLSRRAPARRRP